MRCHAPIALPQLIVLFVSNGFVIVYSRASSSLHPIMLVWGRIASQKNTALDDTPNFRQSVVDSRPSGGDLRKESVSNLFFMKKTRRPFRRESHVFQAVRLPAMMTEMMFSAFETIARRSWMLAQGKCSPTECARMVLEKQQALALSGFALLRGASATSIWAPFHRGVTANAKRLRRK